MDIRKQNLKLDMTDVQTSSGMAENNSSKFMKFNSAILFIVALVFCASINTDAQPRNNEYQTSSIALTDYLERHAHEVPPRATRERLEEFEELIRYFSTLSFTRPGVTVSANFLRALISAESAADPNAVSHMNAIGLTQITYETGRVAARSLYNMNHEFRHVDRERLKNLQPSDLFDPAINILICVYLMDKYNNDYGGNLALTVSAWNAGPGAVTRFRGYPPYDETMTLIARVESYFRYYRRHHL